MDAGPYIAIFDELCQLIESDAERAKRIASGGGFGEIDPAIKSLDDRFYDHDPYNVITPANARWLRGLPEVKVIPDGEYSDALRALSHANHQRAARAAERQGIALDWALTDPLRVASRLLCMQAECLPVVGYGAGDPASRAPDGREGIAWSITTSHGQRFIFLFDDKAFLCEAFLSNGQPLTDESIAETRQRLLAGNLEGMEVWANIEYREIVQIPFADVHSAIEAAKQFPVVKSARQLVAKLGTDESVDDVFAAAKHMSGRWLWMIKTNRRVAALNFLDDSVALLDTEKRPLAILSRSETEKPDESPRHRRIPDEILTGIIAKFSLEYIQFSAFTAVFLIFILQIGQISPRMMLISFAIYGYLAYRFFSLRKKINTLLPNNKKFEDITWLYRQFWNPRIILVAILSASFTSILMLTSLQLNNIFISIYGEVPYLDIAGHKLRLTSAIAITILILGIVGLNYISKKLAKRLVAGWRAST